MFGKAKPKVGSGVLPAFDEFQDTMKEFEIKTGSIKIFRIKRDLKNPRRESKPKKYVIDTRPVRDFRDSPVEERLFEDYGGGEFEMQVFKEAGGAYSYVRTLHYLIRGESQEEEEDASCGSWEDLAYKALEQQINDNSSDQMNQILLKLIDSFQGKQSVKKSS